MDRERKKRREENYFCFAGKRKTREFIPAKAQSTTRLAQKNATARTFLGHGGCSEKFTLTKCAGQLKNPGRFHKISNEWCASSLSLSLSTHPSIHPSFPRSLSYSVEDRIMKMHPSSLIFHERDISVRVSRYDKLNIGRESITIFKKNLVEKHCSSWTRKKANIKFLGR